MPYTSEVEDSKDHNTLETGEGRLHHTKGVPSYLTAPDY
jgi:hypothetical protein